MSEPCEHQRDEAAWIWQEQLSLVKAERDAAQARLKRVEELLDNLQVEHEEGWFLTYDSLTNNTAPLRAVTVDAVRQALGPQP